MKLPEVLIYDFDGVICDSVNIKTEAFVEMYQPYGTEIQGKVETYHLMHGGISRFEKFEYFETQLLGKILTKSRLNDLAKQFSSLVKDKVIKANYISGALEFISNNKNRRQFICTGTPENEIKEIIKAKGIDVFFEKLYGSPSSKSSIIKKIIRECNINPDECIFFGDAITDYTAALDCEIPFVGVQENFNEKIFPNGTSIIKNFSSVM